MGKPMMTPDTVKAATRWVRGLLIQGITHLP